MSDFLENLEHGTAAVDACLAALLLDCSLVLGVSIGSLIRLLIAVVEEEPLQGAVSSTRNLSSPVGRAYADGDDMQLRSVLNPKRI